MPGLGQASPRGPETVCPPETEGDGARFSDLGTVHDANIRCAADHGIVQGHTDGTFGPTHALSRAQMATIVRNLIETAMAAPLPTGTPGRFTDIDGNVHADNIEALADAGVVNGRTQDRYDPAAAVRRDEMATFVANALDLIDDGLGNDTVPRAALGRAGYTDVPHTNVHADSIDFIGLQGIAAGVRGTPYHPTTRVTRAQVTTFVVQGAEYLAAAVDAWAPAWSPLATPAGDRSFAVSPETDRIISSPTFRFRAEGLTPGQTYRLVLANEANVEVTDEGSYRFERNPDTGLLDPGELDSRITAVLGTAIDPAVFVADVAADDDGRIAFQATIRGYSEGVVALVHEETGAALRVDESGTALDAYGASADVYNLGRETWTTSDFDGDVVTFVAGRYAAVAESVAFFHAGDRFYLVDYDYELGWDGGDGAQWEPPPTVRLGDDEFFGRLSPGDHLMVCGEGGDYGVVGYRVGGPNSYCLEDRDASAG